MRYCVGLVVEIVHGGMELVESVAIIITGINGDEYGKNRREK